MYLLTAQEMRNFDQYTIEHVGLPGVVLMENAGRAVAEEIQEAYPNPGRAVVLAGSGNNGGDGFVVARYLNHMGWNVNVWLVGVKEKMSPDAQIHYRACQSLIQVYHDPIARLEELQQQLSDADVIVDAMLGIGTKGRLRSPFSQVVELVNQRKKGWVVAVDLPSGVETDTGKVGTEAIRADLTITFAHRKWGHILRPGADFTGRCKVVEIGIVPNQEPISKINHPRHWQHVLMDRSPWSHKGDYGHLLIIGGSSGMTGAAVMAAQSAFRTGIGKVTITVPESEQQICASQVPQAMTWSWPGTKQFQPNSYRMFLERSREFSAVTIGTGLGRFSGEDQWLGTLLKQIQVPLILDADALNILANYPEILNHRSRSLTTICTPHPGEMARLLDCSVREVEANRSTIALDYAKKTGMIVVLKGRYSVIAFPDGSQRINLSGHASLAKAGSGDLLTGIIGSFMAQGLDPKEAVSAGVYIHGKAGELAVSNSSHSVIYTDILAQLGPILHQLTSKPTYFPGN